MMTSYILENFIDYFEKIGLCRAITAIQYGIKTNYFHSFSFLELYNPEIGTFSC